MYKYSDFRLAVGEKKPSKGKARRNPIKATAGKGTRSAHWAAYVKRMTRGNPSLNG